MSRAAAETPEAASARELAVAIGARRLSASEALEALTERARRLNEALNAVCTFNDRAAEEAAACDRRLAAGAAPRPLEGVPFLVKDNIETAGLRTTYGSRVTRDHVPERDAVVVRRLRAAGGVLLGKTNTPEFAADINTSNLVFGQTRNPWDLNTSPGGSSGGTGAAVAAGLAPFGIGTDLGGSIRIPAAFNGVAGLRPVPGRVPVYPQAFAWDTIIAHVPGPMARHVVDLGLVLSVIAGPDDLDPTSLPAPAVDLSGPGDGSVAGARVAYAGDLGGAVPVHPEVAAVAERAACSLADLGCGVEAATFDGSLVPAIMTGTRAFNLVARYAERYDARRDQLTPAVASQVETALGVDLRRLARAERLRTEHWHRVRGLLERFDFIVTPTVGAAPFRLDEPLPTRLGERELESYYDVILTTYAFSLTGLPALSVPAGLTPAGLPVGLQIVGHRHREDRVLALGAAYEAALADGFARPPPIDPSTIAPVSDALSLTGVPVTR